MQYAGIGDSQICIITTLNFILEILKVDNVQHYFSNAYKMIFGIITLIVNQESIKNIDLGKKILKFLYLNI